MQSSWFLMQFKFLTTLSLLLPIGLCSQNPVSSVTFEKQQFVGLQLNPYLYEIADISYLRYNSKAFAIRYGLKVYKELSLGTEVSGMYSSHDDGWYKSSRTNIGLLARYAFLTDRPMRILVETCTYYQFGKYYQDGLPEPDWSNNKFSWYGSAGIGIKLYKNKVSLDLMAKYSPDVQFEGTKFVPTYKINFHFK